MVESEFERLGKSVNVMIERFSRLREERNGLAGRLEQSEKRIIELTKEVEELTGQRNQVRSRLDGLISQLEKSDL